MEPSDKRTKAASAGARSETDRRATLGSLKKIISLYAVSFLLLATVVVGFIWHDLRGEYLDTLAYWNGQLSTSADDRVRISTLWLNERRTDTMVVAESDGTVRLVSAKGSRSQVAEIRQEVERGMAAIAAGNGFLGGAVGDGDCRIVAQTGLRSEMVQGVQKACRAVQKAGEYRFDAFGMEQGHVWLSFSAPVMAESQAPSSAPLTPRMVGAVVMVAGNWRDTIPIFESESVPPRASETLIVWKKAREAFIFSPRLSAQGVQSLFRWPLNGESFESRVALDGDVTFGEFIDYRGVRVFGTARRLALGGDSLARKVDRDAALSEYFRHRVLDWLVGTLSLLLLGSLMVAQQRHAAARDSEERVRQEEALRERDRRYRVLFESAGDGIFLMQGDHFVDCNQKALELFGCGREQLIGNTPSAFSPPQQPNGSNSQEAALERIRLAQEGQILHFEWRHLRGDGTPFEAAVTLSRLEIAGEAHLLALVKDVTESKRAEEELRLTQFSVEHASDAIFWIDAQSHIVYVNEAACRSLGRSREELHSLSILDIDPLFPKEAWGAIWEKVKTRGSITFETKHQTKQGWVFPVEVTASYLEFAGKEYSFAFARDITERKRVEEALHQSDQRYKDFIAHSHEGVWRLELEQPIPIGLPEEEIIERLMQYGYIAECNLAYARILGFSTSEEIIGIRIRDLVFSSDQERLESFRSSVRSGLGSRSVEFRGRDRAGNLKHFLRTEIPIVENGMFVRAWGITRDVTELKRTEEELRCSFDQLRALAARLQSIREEERKRVAREIHDQLGQALTAIKIDLSSLARELPAGENPQSERASSILKLVDESIRVVRRISTELRPGMLDDLGLVATIEWAGEEFESRTGTKCRFDMPREDIAIDPERATAIFRIFQETLTNVARHAEASEVDVRIAKENGDLTLKVHDNGKGIPADKLATGQSLGILGMREQAMLLGGELTVSAPPGNGTTVRVRIPDTGRT